MPGLTPEECVSEPDVPRGGALLRAHLRTWRTWYRASPSLRVFLLYRPGPGPMLASALRRTWTRWRNPHVDLRFIGPVYLGPGFSLDAPRGGTFIVGPGCEFRRNFRLELGGPEARVEIGGASVFTYDVVMQCSSSITVGNHCMFGQATLVVDGNHNFRDLDRPMLEQGYTLSPITVGDHVTTTTKCTIIADIGTRTVLGANSVVSRPLPPFCVAAGAPARVLDYFGPPEQRPAELVGS